jgi:hypothetical protein
MSYKLEIHSSFLKMDCHYDKPVSLYVDRRIIDTNNDFKIALLIEPNTIRPDYHKYILENYNRFNYILTYDSDILKLPNAILFEFGCPWIQHLGYGYPEKEFGVSIVISNKLMAPGHYLRKELWERQNEILINKRFFRSFYGSFNGFENTPILGQDKYPLFNTTHSIIIENTKSDYYFTEKITDCLITKTIPIYWGANKISNYFDNIIQIQSVDEIINACNSLNPGDYSNSFDIIENNFSKAIEFEKYNEKLNNKINQLTWIN